MTVKIDGESLRIEDVVRVARHGDFVQLTDVAGEKVLRSRQVLEALAKNSKRPIYGVNTGFGRLVTKRISPDELRQLQENLILSHSAGVGFPLPQEVVRATMLLRVNSLAKGYSGVRLVILDTLVEMLNKKVHPVVPRKGSLGASGDLAPLAHIAAVMLGRGKAYFNGTPFSGEVAMGKAGIKTIKLESKEGLALINGTQASSAVLSLAAYNSEHLLKMSDVLGALSVFMLNGNISQFAQEIQSVRPHPGQIISAKNLRRLFGDAAQGSRENLQDAYSLRCIPQVHGAVRAALRHAISVLVT
ncbi:aromatic amino acid lyase, partial [Candidatus Bipolaricaulota bacterium]|nr:aromatic amino acid lyase [Candidatus Bipolaricaulota bacterium]